uniref:beta-1,3-galactosyltransferase brn-like n=1 Tax=Styela clava TaxID=7725 RepID=UPI001939B993|nr:beta-1,3-galactosyltransferase brn-like [Styela clava]
MHKKKIFSTVCIFLAVSAFYGLSLTWKEVEIQEKTKASQKKIKLRLSRTFNHDVQSFNQVKFMNKVRKTKRNRLNFTMLPWKYSHNYFVGDDVNYSMIILIKSHANNTRRRQFIGNSWGSSAHVVNGFRFEIVFIVGLSDSKGNLALQKENENHGDLLQTTFIESYENLVYKTLAGMQWAVETFPENWFYASMDDDVLPDLVKISKDLQEIMEREKLERLRLLFDEPDIDSSHNFNKDIKYKHLTDLPIYCGFGYRLKPRPKRLKESKWFMAEDEYPLKIYPSYCFGGFYAMTLKLAQDFYDLSRTLPMFWIDDIWITGFLRLKYFLGKSSQCVYCKVMNTTMGLWTEYPEEYTTVDTGNENFLVQEWFKLQSKMTKIE